LKTYLRVAVTLAGMAAAVALAMPATAAGSTTT
jgi:hypothetical protein